MDIMAPYYTTPSKCWVSHRGERLFWCIGGVSSAWCRVWSARLCGPLRSKGHPTRNRAEVEVNSIDPVEPKTRLTIKPYELLQIARIS